MDINIALDINIAIDIDIAIDIVVNVDIQGRRGGERAGRDGGHAHEDPPPAESRALRFPFIEEGVSREVSSKNTIDKRTTCSAPTDSYLPAADDYDYQEDSLAGYDPSQVGPSRVFSQPI